MGRLGTAMIVGMSAALSMASVVQAEHDLAQRLRHDAQVQSNNGKYEDARQLRAIADALKDKDASTAQQVQAEITKGNRDKAMDLLKVR